MKLFYIMKISQPELEPTIEVLCKRESKSEKYDWKKLPRQLGFVKVTINNKRISGASRMTDMWMWVDSEYAVHYYMRIHTGRLIPMGIRKLHSKS